MPKKPYNFTDAEDEPMTLNEPALAYQTAYHSDVMVADVPTSKRFNNPNVPLECTQEEFVEYIRGIEERIERGEFKTAEQSKRDFDLWKKELLASRI